MSTSIDQSFIKDYVADVHEAFQQRGSRLLATVRRKPNVKGSTTTFQKVGKGTATTKARHGKVTFDASGGSLYTSYTARRPVRGGKTRSKWCGVADLARSMIT